MQCSSASVLVVSDEYMNISSFTHADRYDTCNEDDIERPHARITHAPLADR